MPYYQFNSFTGRITESTHPQPLYPLAPNRLEAAEPPKIMYATAHTKPVKIAPPTRLQSAFSTVAPEVMKKMKQFQAHNDLPVHIKGGAGDRILFGATAALCVVGVAGCFKLYYDLAFPRSS